MTVENRLRPHLLVLCETRQDECNCHPPENMRWARTMPDYLAEPIPVCQECWESCDDVPCEWNELEAVTL